MENDNEIDTITTEMKSDGSCPINKDGRHCECWWDGDAPCCSCGFNGELDNE